LLKIPILSFFSSQLIEERIQDIINSDRYVNDILNPLSAPVLSTVSLCYLFTVFL
jgi:hypothetical protein